MKTLSVALLSFALGAASMLSIGEHTSILAASPQSISSPGAQPLVPPLTGAGLTGAPLRNLTYQLDGLTCTNCTFDNVIFEYAGGAYKLENVQMSGNVGVRLTGAAANTANFLQAFGLFGHAPATNKPEPSNPNSPIIISATLRRPIKTDVRSPFGQR